VQLAVPDPVSDQDAAQFTINPVSLVGPVDTAAVPEVHTLHQRCLQSAGRRRAAGGDIGQCDQHHTVQNIVSRLHTEPVCAMLAALPQWLHTTGSRLAV